MSFDRGYQGTDPASVVVGPASYVPTMTPGRVLYERWLAIQDISPDDLWDYLDPHERIAWESLAASEGAVQ